MDPAYSNLNWTRHHPWAVIDGLQWTVAANGKDDGRRGRCVHDVDPVVFGFSCSSSYVTAGRWRRVLVQRDQQFRICREVSTDEIKRWREKGSCFPWLPQNGRMNSRLPANRAAAMVNFGGRNWQPGGVVLDRGVGKWRGGRGEFIGNTWRRF